MSESTVTLPDATLRLSRGRAITSGLLVLGASIVIALAAQIAISVPFSPVPLTLQPVAVLLVGIALGSRRGAAAAALYLLEGASGLPVFAQAHGGAIWLAGPTAGYLLSYPAAAWVSGWLSEKGFSSSSVRAFFGMLTALAVIYAGGWSWLSILTNPRFAYQAGVKYFLVADIVKIALGALLLPSAQRLVTRLSAR